MKWHDEGIILKIRPYGETSTLLEVMTLHHGRRVALVRQKKNHKLRAMLQPGNCVDIQWSGRLEENLGFFQIEPIHLYGTKCISNPTHIFCLWILIFYLHLLPERDPYPRLYKKSIKIIGSFDYFCLLTKGMALFELLLLEELGFGLDLKQCVLTGKKDALVFVSPKSGCAVSRNAGEPWKNKLLPLPKFLIAEVVYPKFVDIEQAFYLTGFFLNRYVYEVRGIKEPLERATFLESIKKNQHLFDMPVVA